MSNYAHVLVCIAQDSNVRMRDVASRVGITERSAFHIVDALEKAGVVTRVRDGRRNHYEIHREVPLRHPLAVSRTVGGLLALLLDSEESTSPKET